jgi:hypothetical protein
VCTDEKKVYTGTKAQVKLKSSAGREPLFINAEIVRTYRRKSMPFYYSGLEFEDQNEKNIQLLLDLLSEIKK